MLMRLFTESRAAKPNRAAGMLEKLEEVRRNVLVEEVRLNSRCLLENLHLIISLGQGLLWRREGEEAEAYM